MSDWRQVCVVCASRGRQTKIEDGHCCAVCRQRIADDLAAVVQFGDLTATEPRTGQVGQSGTGWESKPPTDLDRTAPYLVLVRLNPGQIPAVTGSVAEILSQWERMLRESRGLTLYGPATAHHVGTDEGLLAAQATRQAVSVLRMHVEWITTDVEWPLEDFADEVRKCASRMRALACPDAGRDRMVTCPTISEDGADCGCRITVRTWAALDEDAHGRRDWSIGEDVTCPRCGVTRSPEQLLHAAGKDDTWADAEALASWLGIDAKRIRRWAAEGLVRKVKGMYSWADVSAAVEDQRKRAYRRLAQGVQQ